HGNPLPTMLVPIYHQEGSLDAWPNQPSLYPSRWKSVSSAPKGSPPPVGKVPALDIAKFREDFAKAIDRDRPFYLERPPIFSPAAAAQDAANSSRMLWCWAPIWIPWEYTRWLDEGRSFHDTAYIGDWSALVKVNIKGKQALQFLSHIGTNDLSKFSIGQVKHHVQT